MSEPIEMLCLRDRDLRREGFFVAEGRLLVERTIAAGFAVEVVFADPSAAAEAEAMTGTAPAGRKIAVQVCAQGELDRIAGFPFHRGLFALARRPDVLPVSPGDARSDSPSRILVLPCITDPGNLGTLLRSALAFGYDEVWLGKETCDPFNRKALRASMGAALVLALCEAEPGDLASLREPCGRRIPVYAAAMEENALRAGTAAEKTGGAHALVLGNEYSGIPPHWRAQCTAAIRIPVSAAVDSLNVSIAGSILMWELNRQALS